MLEQIKTKHLKFQFIEEKIENIGIRKKNATKSIQSVIFISIQSKFPHDQGTDHIT